MMFYYTPQNSALERQEAYWKKQFTEAPHRVELPLDNPRPPATSFLRSEVSLTLDSADVGQLFEFCRDRQLIPAQMLLGAFALLLFRYTGQEDVIVCTAVYVHNDSRQEHSPLINPLMLKLCMSADMSVHDLLEHLLETSDAACRNSMYPFEQIAAALDSDPTGQDIPLLQNMLITDSVLANHSPDSYLQVCIDSLAEYSALSDLFVTAGSSGETVLLTADYNSQLFFPATVQRFLKHFSVLLKHMIKYFDTPLASIPMMSTEEYQQLLSPGSEPSQHYPPDLCLHQLFEKQVNKTPDAVAAVFQTEQLTYQEINYRANRLAHFLRQCGVGPNTLVGICLERSLEMVIGILGIFKAGAAYLPLDPDYPEERLSFMVHDAEMPVIISQHPLSAKIDNTGCRIIDLHHDGETIAAQPTDNPEILSSPLDTAYVIYTSGSTGNPKGTLVSHFNVVRLFQSTDAWFGFHERDVWTLFHSFAFDFSVWELWGALLYGGKLIVIPYLTSRSPEAFYQILCSEGVTVLNQTPSAFRQLMAVEQSNGADQNLKLRFVIFGGEALEPKTLRPWLDNHGDDSPHLINMYGITETTVHVTYRPITRKDLNSVTRSSIGVPIPDLSLHICDPALHPLPIGVPGEIYVGGSGVAQGYLNRPDLSAERFIANPFTNQAGSRLYKTGDLGRLLPDYDIEYLGRIDQQVKIRGFRIELGEIESVLNGHEGIRVSIAVVNEDEHGDKSIIAYYVPYRNRDFDIITLKHLLREKLPSYMIPSVLIPIEEFPLTENGKLDYKALPAPDHSRPESEQTYVAPDTDMERIISKIWTQALSLEQVGTHDNFFELGGHSIMIIGVHEKISEAFDVIFEITDMFKYPTISSLSKFLGQKNVNKFSDQEISDRAQQQRTALKKQRQRIAMRKRNVK